MKLGSPITQTVAITAIFVGIYFGLRAIPASQCGFLHYEPVEILADGTEKCEGSPLPFIDVRRTPFPVRLNVLSQRVLEETLEVEIRLELRGPDDRALMPHQLAITHTERIHLMLVDEAMGHYHHLHPMPEGDSGIYTVRFQPTAKRYRYFAEFVPVRTRQLAVADGKFEIPVGLQIQPEQEPTSLVAELAGRERPIRRNRDTILTLRLTDSVAEIPQIEPIMGAYAHVVGFEETLSGYAHMHPLSADPRRADHFEMEFLFHPTRPGNYRIWVQVKHNGKEQFIPFDATVL